MPGGNRIVIQKSIRKSWGPTCYYAMSICLSWGILVGVSLAEPQTLTLLEEGKSRYQIVVDPAASASEVYAAEEFQSHFKACTGVTLPVRQELPSQNQPAIIIGFGAATKQLGLPGTDEHLPEQACMIKTVGAHLVIAGTKSSGTLHGVHRFLEDVLGIRWFAPGVTRTPRHRNLILPGIDRTIQPSFLFRQASYGWPGHDADFLARIGYNRGNGTVDNPQGEQYAFHTTCHSYFMYVSPEEFFDTHPEYFSEIGGKRIREETQLCLTNPDVLEIVTQRLLDAMKSCPEFKQFNFSQMDYYNYCECPKCRAMNEKYRTTGGTQFWFVNQLAQRTAQVFPDKLIGTLAYTFTEEPPQGMEMHPNAAVWLCHMFPCCDSHPIASCPLNADYKRRATAWSQLCSHLYIWHYIVNFAHYYMPFPNFRAMASDIRFYKSIGAEGMFLQGGSSEFDLLRGYYGQKLLCDADQDPDAILQDFLQGYYGPAAPSIWQYITLLHEKVEKDNIHMHLYTNPAQGYLTDEVMAKAETFFDQAESQVQDDADLLERVKVARMPLQYAALFPRNGYTIRGQQLIFNGEVAGAAVAQDFIQRLHKHQLGSLREYNGQPEQLLLFAQLFSNPVDLVTLENDSLHLDIAPSLGGRILQIMDRKTGQNITAANVPQNLYFPFSDGLGNFVGGQFNPCGFLEPGFVTASDGRSVTMNTVTLDGFELRRTIELDGQKPTVRVINTLTNPSEAARTVLLRSHLMLDAGSLHTTRIAFRSRGGQDTQPDITAIIGNLREGIVFSGADAPDASWSFQGDKGLRIMQTFDNEQVDLAWLCAYPDSLGALEVELWSPRRMLAPKESITLNQTITVKNNE